MAASEFSNIKWITTNINSSARQAHWTFTRRVNQEETVHNYIFTSTGLEQNIMTNLHCKPLLWHQNMTCGAPISNLEESLPFTSEKMAVCSVLKQVPWPVISHLMGHTRVHFMQLNLANCKRIAVHWWLHEACERALLGFWGNSTWKRLTTESHISGTGIECEPLHEPCHPLGTIRPHNCITLVHTQEIYKSIFTPHACIHTCKNKQYNWRWTAQTAHAE